MGHIIVFNQSNMKGEGSQVLAFSDGNMIPDPSSSDSFTTLSGLAHELDSPLKSILARTQKLIADYKDRDFEFISYKDFKVIISTLEQIERQLEHCSQTTSRMLYVGKRQTKLEENK